MTLRRHAPSKALWKAKTLSVPPLFGRPSPLPTAGPARGLETPTNRPCGAEKRGIPRA
jgi:hypothetical protein